MQLPSGHIHLFKLFFYFILFDLRHFRIVIYAFMHSYTFIHLSIFSGYICAMHLMRLDIFIVGAKVAFNAYVHSVFTYSMLGVFVFYCVDIL